jgi:hypothetical protein
VKVDGLTAAQNTEPPNPNGHLSSVVISRAEYDNLTAIAKQYGSHASILSGESHWY